MFKQFTLAAAALSSAALVVPAESAEARRGYSNHYGYSQNYRNYRGNDRRYYGRNYYGRNYRRGCKSGTTGAIVGAAGGALLGREIAGRGDRTMGTILGAAIGGLAGRELTRTKRCYR
jgi:Glycine zipper 2TM domain